MSHNVLVGQPCEKTVLFWKESPEALLVFRYVLWLPGESQNPGIFHFSRVFSAQLSDQLQ